MALIRDALGKLRAVEADQLDQNSGEGAMRRVYLYRGMKDVAAQGGTKLPAHCAHRPHFQRDKL